MVAKDQTEACSDADANSRFTLDRNTLMFVSEDYRGLYYPKYFATFGDFIDCYAFGSEFIHRLMESFDADGVAEGYIFTNHTFLLEIMSESASLMPLTFATDDPFLVFQVVPAGTLEREDISAKLLQELCKENYDDASGMVTGIGFDISYWDYEKI